jgi:hypothetical protein
VIPKSKMVSFRLSNEEYARYRSACTALGARNLSELARVAMAQITAEPTSRTRRNLTSQMRDLRAKIAVLSGELDRLSRIVDTPESQGENRHNAASQGST